MITCVICTQAETESLKLCNLDTIESKNEISVWEMISSVTNIKLHLIENMSSICTKCVCTAKDAYQFKQQCINAKERQTKHLESSNNQTETKIKSEPVENDNEDVFISETFITCVDDFSSYIAEDSVSNIPNESKVSVEENQIDNNKESTEIANNSKSHFEITVYLCKVCEFEAENVQEIESHVKTEHSEKSSDPYKVIKKAPYTCAQCDAEFFSVVVFKQHLAHHKSEKFEHVRCEICGFKTFKAYLERHMETRHTNDDKSICPECGKLCGNVLRLKKHLINYHSENALYKCEYCNISFANSKILTAHLNKHKNLTPYKCNQCPKEYTSLRSMNAHQRYAHNKQKELTKIECKDCGIHFTRRNSLNRHRRNKHGDKINEKDMKKNLEVEYDNLRHLLTVEILSDGEEERMEIIKQTI